MMKLTESKDKRKLRNLSERKGILCTIADNGRYNFAFHVCFSFFLPVRAPYLPSFLFCLPRSFSLSFWRLFFSPRHSGTTIYSIAPGKLRPGTQGLWPDPLKNLISWPVWVAQDGWWLRRLLRVPSRLSCLCYWRTGPFLMGSVAAGVCSCLTFGRGSLSQECTMSPVYRKKQTNGDIRHGKEPQWRGLDEWIQACLRPAPPLTPQVWISQSLLSWSWFEFSFWNVHLQRNENQTLFHFCLFKLSF